MLNQVIVRAIFQAASTTVEYISGEGALCPVCLNILHRRNRARVYNTSEGGVRYCRCDLCGISFKAVEKEVVSEIPEIIAPKKKTRQNRTRKR